MTRINAGVAMSEEREKLEKLEPCPKLREAIENGHLRCSVSVGVGSPVATIDTEDLWRLVHAAERSLFTSSAERGMREALEAIKRMPGPAMAGPTGLVKFLAYDRVVEIIDAALSSKGEG